MAAPRAEGVKCRSVRERHLSTQRTRRTRRDLDRSRRPASFVPSVAAAQRSTTFRTGVDLVNLGVTVTDKKGTLVADLTAEDFEITEDGKRQTLGYFAAGDRVGAGAASRAAARRQREHGRRHRLHEDRRDQVPEYADRRRGHHGRRLRLPGQGGPVHAARVRPPGRAHSAAEDRREHGSLRRHRHVSRRRRQPGRPQDHVALHRRRRHAAARCGSASSSIC